MEPRPLPDPLLEAVRRRHRDVDVVLLPLEGPPRPCAPVAADVVGASLIRVATAARHLWSAVMPQATTAPEVRFTYGTEESEVRAVARVTTRSDDGRPALAALRHELERDGWDVAHPGDGLERLHAWLEDLAVSASYAEAAGALLLEVRGGSLPVGRSRARDLVRGQAVR